MKNKRAALFALFTLSLFSEGALGASHSAWSGFFSLPGVVDAVEKPAPVSLKGAWITASPNPFNASVQIRIEGVDESKSQSTGANLKAAVYTLDGRKIIALFPKSGSRNLTWTADNVPSGLYLIKVLSGRQSVTKVISLVK